MANRTYSVAALACCWSVGLATLALGQSSVSSTNQSGGVTASHIDVVNVIPSSDPKREALAGMMVRHNEESSSVTRKARDIQYYIVLADPRDAEFAPPDKDSFVVYSLTALSSPFGSLLFPNSCPIGRVAELAGGRAIMTRHAGKADIKLQFTPRGDRIVASVCNGLGRPTREMYDVRSAGEDISVYDFLSHHGQLPIQIIVGPASLDGVAIDTNWIRGYWASAFQKEYLGSEALGPSLENDPTAVAQVAAIANNKSDSLTISRNLPAPFEKLDIAHPYPPELAARFGGLVEAMDALWLKYLDSSAISLQGQKRTIKDGSRFLQVMPVFSARDVGMPSFWAHLSDSKEVWRQLNCIGARFAVENGYAKVTELSAYDDCALAQIRKSP